MRKLLSGFALAVLMTLGIAGTAHAANYTCKEGGDPPPNTQVTGDVTIQVNGICTLDNVSATGTIIVNTSGGSISAGNLTGNTGVQVEADGNVVVGSVSTDLQTAFAAIGIGSTQGSVTTGALQNTSSPGTLNNSQIGVDAATTVTINGVVTAGSVVNISAPNANIITLGTTANTVKITGAVSAPGGFLTLMAGGNISAGGLTSFGGQIQVHANVGATSTTATAAFTTGSSGANGIGFANASGTSPSGATSSIYISNGGTGGIAVSAGSNLSALSNSATPSGIVLDACNENDADLTCSAPITIGSGSIVTDGTSSFPAGIQLYIAKTITLSGTTLSAKDTAPAASHPEHYVTLAASTVTLNGTGLIINSNGAQPPSPGLNASAQINNQGASSASDGFVPGNQITIGFTGPQIPL